MARVQADQLAKNAEAMKQVHSPLSERAIKEASVFFAAISTASFAMLQGLLAVAALGRAFGVAIACFAVTMPVGAGLFIHYLNRTTDPTIRFRGAFNLSSVLCMILFVVGMAAVFCHFSAWYAVLFVVATVFTLWLYLGGNVDSKKATPHENATVTPEQ
jgi:Ca2+/Na+ antiporter